MDWCCLLHAAAQVAANTKGIQLVLELIAEHSLEVVQAYMSFIQANAGEGPTHACLHWMCHSPIAKHMWGQRNLVESTLIWDMCNG